MFKRRKARPYLTCHAELNDDRRIELTLKYDATGGLLVMMAAAIAAKVISAFPEHEHAGVCRRFAEMVAEAVEEIKEQRRERAAPCDQAPPIREPEDAP